MAQSNPAVLGPVESSVRPHALAVECLYTDDTRTLMSEGRKALLAAFGAAAAAREQDLRGQYPKAARVLVEEIFRLRAALRQKHAEYDDMKSLLLGNVRNVHLEGERAREVLRRMLEAPTTQIGTTWKDAARQGLALGPNADLSGRTRSA